MPSCRGALHLETTRTRAQRVRLRRQSIATESEIAPSRDPGTRRLAPRQNPRCLADDPGRRFWGRCRGGGPRRARHRLAGPGLRSPGSPVTPVGSGTRLRRPPLGTVTWRAVQPAAPAVEPATNGRVSMDPNRKIGGVAATSAACSSCRLPAFGAVPLAVVPASRHGRRGRRRGPGDCPLWLKSTRSVREGDP